MINPSEAYVTIPAKEYADLVNAKEELLAALKLLFNDPRFQVSVGGNPIALQKMLEQISITVSKWGPS